MPPRQEAKGLDACVVFIPAAEEEVIPGDRGGTDEARRLFYVSLTRAKRALFITHAVRRTGAQAYSGIPGRTHSRTSFLRTRGFSTPGTAFARDFVVDPRATRTRGRGKSVARSLAQLRSRSPTISRPVHRRTGCGRWDDVARAPRSCPICLLIGLGLVTRP